MNIQPINTYYNGIYNNNYTHSPVEFRGKITQKLVGKTYDTFVKVNAESDAIHIIKNRHISLLERHKDILEKAKTVYSFVPEYKPLAQYIDYKPADNIEDAVDFARKNLGVEDFNVKALDVANLINRIITRVSNYAYGDVLLPLHLNVQTLKNIDTMGKSVVAKRELYLNDILFNDAFYYFDFCREKMEYVLFHELGHYINELKKYIQLAGSDITKNLIDSMIEAIAARQKVIDYLESRIHKFPASENLSQTEKLKTMMNFRNIYPPTILRDDYQKLDNQYTSLFNKSAEYSDKFFDVFASKPFDSVQKQIALKISDYAGTDEGEFLAEVFAKICESGLSSIPDDVMALYKQLGGVILPNFPK